MSENGTPTLNTTNPSSLVLVNHYSDLPAESWSREHPHITQLILQTANPETKRAPSLDYEWTQNLETNTPLLTEDDVNGGFRFGEDDHLRKIALERLARTGVDILGDLEEVEEHNEESNTTEPIARSGGIVYLIEEARSSNYQ